MVFKNTFERRLFGIGLAYSAVAAAVMLAINGHVFTSTDSMSYTYIAASVVRNGEHSKIANIGTVWLPMLHILLTPFTLLKPLYTTGLAGTVVNGLATGGALVYLARVITYITDRKDVLYGGIVLFLSSAMTAIYAATPMMEQLAIFFGLAGVYYFTQYWKEDYLPHFVLAGAFVVLATMTRYEFWFVATAFVVAMVTKELRGSRQYNLAFFHLPLWGGGLWVIWNGAIFGDPFAFFAGRTMQLSVWLHTSLEKRVLFLAVLLIIGGATFVLPFFLKRENYMLAVAPAVVYAMFVISYLVGFRGLLANLRFGYVVFGMLLPTVVVLRRVSKRMSIAVFGVLVLTVLLSSGLVLTGVYADLLDSSGVQETSGNQPDLPNAVVHHPIQGIYDMDQYPRQYLDSYDGDQWIQASKAPWKSNADYVVIPVDAAGRLEDYRASGPNEGFVWNYFSNSSWRQTFDQHFELVGHVKSGRQMYKLFKQTNTSAKSSANVVRPAPSRHYTGPISTAPQSRTNLELSSRRAVLIRQ